MNGQHLSAAEITELAGGLAHELRNPLSTIMVNLKLLAEDLEDPNTRTEDVRRRALLKLEVVRREAERLQHLFDDFLNLAGPCKLRRTSVDLTAVLARMVEFIEPVARSENIEISWTAAQRPLVCQVDEQLISQALLNLVVNARQAMPTGGTIRLQARIEDGHGVVDVSDTGLGIPVEHANRILRPFFSTKPGGSGLGLSITRRIIEDHGGALTFQSEPGRGTTFTVRLPLDTEPPMPAGACCEASVQ